mmetsp:Transcript_53044/g.171168  ORF Transcript_53044/g.171168 Transcript_53044/m.171168 type:complete len:298 (+) Transcript_53044:414-1307(+)
MPRCGQFRNQAAAVSRSAACERLGNTPGQRLLKPCDDIAAVPGSTPNKFKHWVVRPMSNPARLQSEQELFLREHPLEHILSGVVPLRPDKEDVLETQLLEHLVGLTQRRIRDHSHDGGIDVGQQHLEGHGLLLPGRRLAPEHRHLLGEQRLEPGAPGVADEVPTVDHREATVAISLKQGPQVDKAGPERHIQGHEARLHDVAATLVEGDVHLLVEERIPLQHDVQVVDAFVHRVAHDLGDQYRHHEGHDVGHAARELEHDGHQRDGYPAHSSEHSGRPNHGVDAGLHRATHEVVVTV